MKITLTIKSGCMVRTTIPILVKVKRRLCFVQADHTYQPLYKRHSLPPYCPYLATSNISSNNKVNPMYNSQCSDNKLFTAATGEIRPHNTVFHTTTSSSDSWQERLLSSKSLSAWSIVQLVIQKEACSGEMTRNAL